MDELKSKDAPDPAISKPIPAAISALVQVLVSQATVLVVSLVWAKVNSAPALNDRFSLNVASALSVSLRARCASQFAIAEL